MGEYEDIEQRKELTIEDSEGEEDYPDNESSEDEVECVKRTVSKSKFDELVKSFKKELEEKKKSRKEIGKCKVKEDIIITLPKSVESKERYLEKLEERRVRNKERKERVETMMEKKERLEELRKKISKMTQESKNKSRIIVLTESESNYYSSGMFKYDQINKMKEMKVNAARNKPKIKKIQLKKLEKEIPEKEKVKRKKRVIINV